MDETYYDLDGNPITREAWLRIGRHVHRDEIGPVLVSTMHLGVDHRIPAGSGPPILFESMVFRDGDATETRRYTDRYAARKGHEALVKLARAGRV